MRTWKIQAETEAGIKHYEISAATLQAALGKAMRDILIEKAQRKLAEMGGADVNTPDSR